MTDSNSFSEYGHDFQVKGLTCIFTDKYFLSQIIDELVPEYFEEESTQYLSKIIIEYYKKYKETPSAEVVAFEIGNIKNRELKSECKVIMRKVGTFLGSKDLAFIKESLIQFCKNQEMKKALIASVDLLPSGNYEQIYQIIGKAMNVGIDTNLGHDYEEDFEDRYKIDYHDPMATPWPHINDITKGGPGKGHFCVIMAGPGIGKTWLLTHIGAQALRDGKTVLHYTMELSDIYVGRRYDCVLSGIHIDELDDNKEEVIRRVKAADKGKLVVRNYYSHSVTSLGLQGHVDKCAMMDIKPDIILIDYADLVKMSGIGELRHQIDALYCDFRRMAGEYECPVWTASQLSKEAMNEDYVDGGSAQEAFAKNNAPDFILTASRPAKYRNKNLLFGFVSKNRLGNDKEKFVGEMDSGGGNASLYKHGSMEAIKLLQDNIGNMESVNIKNRILNRINTGTTENSNFSLG